MAKKKTSTRAKASPDVHEDTSSVSYVGDSTTGSLLQAALKKKMKTESVFDGTSSLGLEYGLAMPSLAARAIFSSSCYMLGKLVMVVGKQGSNKSAFMTELQRWHFCSGGFGAQVHTENKDQPRLRLGTFGHNMTWFNEYMTVFPNSTEETQQYITAFAQLYREQCSKKGAIRPFALGQDSLTAKSSEATQKKILDSGHADKSYDDAQNAGLITKYMKSFWPMVEDLPFSWIVVNHIGDKMPTPGQFTLSRQPPEKTSPGGKFQKYAEGVEIEASASKQFQIQSGGKLFTGHTCTFKINKNGWGPKSFPIKVNFLWWFEPDPAKPGHFRQTFTWDWHSATIRLWETAKTYAPKTYAQLTDVCDMRVGDGTPSGMCWSKRLGVPKSDPISYQQMSLLLETKPELLLEIYAVLQIIERPVLAPGQDFRKVIHKKTEAIEVESWKIFQDHQQVPLIDGDAEVEEQATSTEEG